MEQLNDFEKQDLKRNSRLIREIQYDRVADDAARSVLNFEAEFFRTFKHSTEARVMFGTMKDYIKNLKAVNPWKKGQKPKTPTSG